MGGQDRGENTGITKLKTFWKHHMKSSIEEVS